ncbi:MAG: Holliday junction resolvase RuvX [Phycisphaerae bacterium]|jgi:putative Holliday junction resolvase
MRFICIDLGDKRTGLAICDSQEIIASPLEVIEGGGDLAAKILETIKQYQAEGIVFGLPLNMDDSESDRSAAVRKFAGELAKQTTLPIFFQDERLSSFSAQEKLGRTGLTHKKKKNRLDAIAAAEILKEFLSSRK